MPDNPRRRYNTTMDPKIAEKYNDSILHQAVTRFGIDDDKIELLDGFESFIYAFSRDDGDFILRIGHSLRRSHELIQGEVDWINYLAAGGAGVAQPVLSESGCLVEAIEDGQGEYFMATAFKKAAGGPPSKDFWNETLFKAWGRLLGRIHALSKEYSPSDPSWRRGEWNSPANLLVEEYLPESDVKILGKFQTLLMYLGSLLKDQNGYGLIHQDAHGGNIFVDADYKITLFDFDDCVYSWFIYDIAMVFFYGLMGSDVAVKDIEEFTNNFLEGYSTENQLDPIWLAEIPYFLKLREIDLYAHIIFSYGGIENVNHPWCQDYLVGRREKIENDVPFIDFDWSTLSPFLRHI